MELLALEGLGFMIGIFILWYILQVIADWKILSKAGRPGILSLIPFVNVCAEYSVCWSGFMGVVYMVCLVIHIVQSFKLAKAFGKGFGTGLLLLISGPIGRLILGLGSARYVGKP